MWPPRRKPVPGQRDRFAGGVPRGPQVQLDDRSLRHARRRQRAPQCVRAACVVGTDRLGVTSQPTDMSFSVRCERTGLEYNGTSINTLFA